MQKRELYSVQKRQPINIRKILSYPPIRYYACAFLIAYILFNNIEGVASIESQVIASVSSIFNMFSNFNIPSIFTMPSISNIESSYHVGGAMSFNWIHPVKIPILYWFYLQIPFLIFFPTVAIISRISLRMRARIFGFGLLSFFVFVLIIFTTLMVLSGLGNTVDSNLVLDLSALATVIGGYLLIELSLFSTITKPSPVKIKRLVKRGYIGRYAYLLALLFSSFLFLFFLLDIGRTSNSPLVTYTALHFYNIKVLMVFGAFFSAVHYNRRKHLWLKLTKGQDQGSVADIKSITFLIPCRNEEKLVAGCIRSIDRAAAKYPGSVEIIIVNDGSTDKTESAARAAVDVCKRAKTKLYNIPNTGKAFALQYGLQKASGEIIFRIDADSEIHEDAIMPVVEHFKDPQVGCVGGMILPLEHRSIWQKVCVLMYIKFNSLNKRTQDIADSILVQSGAYSAFSKDALIKIGGWSEQFGEDGEITNRMGRYGYKVEFEPDSLLYSDVPDKLGDFLHQRVRWSIAFYHSRGRNLYLVKDPRQFRQPRAILFFISLLSHAGALTYGLALVSLLAALVSGITDLNVAGRLVYSVILPIPQSLMVGTLIIAIMSIALSVYFLKKYGRSAKLAAYTPAVWFARFLVTLLATVLAMEVLLSWSSKWRKYDSSAYNALRQEVKKNVDPLHG